MAKRIGENVDPPLQRRTFLKQLGVGAAVVVVGNAVYQFLGDGLTRKAMGQTRPDGKPRLPPGQHVIEMLRPMGGEEGDPDPANFSLWVHGEVQTELHIDFKSLLAMPQTQQQCDVHCVTTWSVLGDEWKGVQVAHLADLAGVKQTARHVIFEAANGYTSNVLLAEGTAPNVLVAHEHLGIPLARPNGSPVRALVPDLYFWKSAKWLTGIRFAAEDEPGYWEVRGYNNHADPWNEERYA
jgi:DMSO/TMAO reductase YedYZ molybdopterin-dependent catalytic subunit